MAIGHAFHSMSTARFELASYLFVGVGVVGVVVVDRGRGVFTHLSIGSLKMKVILQLSNSMILEIQLMEELTASIWNSISNSSLFKKKGKQ